MLNANALSIIINLSCFVYLGSDKIAEILIENGTNLNIKNNNGHTPLYKAIDSGMK